jgi:hypothetical protein
MSKKKTTTAGKRLRHYLARKPHLECDYTEFGVLSYVVPAPNKNGQAPPRRKVSARKGKAPSTRRK